MIDSGYTIDNIIDEADALFGEVVPDGWREDPASLIDEYLDLGLAMNYPSARDAAYALVDAIQAAGEW